MSNMHVSFDRHLLVRYIVAPVDNVRVCPQSCSNDAQENNSRASHPTCQTAFDLVVMYHYHIRVSSSDRHDLIL